MACCAISQMAFLCNTKTQSQTNSSKECILFYNWYYTKICYALYRGAEGTMTHVDVILQLKASEGTTKEFQHKCQRFLTAQHLMAKPTRPAVCSNTPNK